MGMYYSVLRTWGGLGGLGRRPTTVRRHSVVSAAYLLLHSSTSYYPGRALYYSGREHGGVWIEGSSFFHITSYHGSRSIVLDSLGCVVCIHQIYLLMQRTLWE